MGSARGNDKERVLHLDACPARRHGCYIAEGVAKKEQVIAPMDPPLDAIDFLSEQRVKRLRYSDGGGHFSRATCS